MKILIVIANGLHIGYLGCYGNEWMQTPALDRLASQGVVFDEHFAANPDLHSARRIFYTGRYLFAASPSTKEGAGILGHLEGRGVCAQVVEIAHDPAAENALRAFTRALDRVAGAEHWLIICESNDLLKSATIPVESSQRGEEEDAAETEDETPSDDDREFLDRQTIIAAAVTQFDGQLNKIVKELERRGWQDDVHVLVTAHCGLDAPERRTLFPAWSALHEERIHIPLVWRLPGGAEAGRRVLTLTQPVDLVPTLCELLGVPSMPVHGSSLSPLLTGKTGHIRAYACSGLFRAGAAELALRTPQWSFHLPLQPPAEEGGRQPLLYVKPDDRWGVNDLHQHYADWCERLESCARGFARATQTEDSFQPPPLPDFITKEEQAADEPDRKEGDT